MTGRRLPVRYLVALALVLIALWSVPVSTPGNAAAIPSCMNIQLNIQAVRESGATGHLGVMYRIQNLWI